MAILIFRYAKKKLYKKLYVNIENMKKDIIEIK